MIDAQFGLTHPSVMHYDSSRVKPGEGVSPMASVAFIPSPSRQLDITLPENVMQELEEIATRNNRSVDELVMDALGLLKIASDAALNRQRLAVLDDNGKVLKQIVVFR
jgi:hypothetical protein